MISRLVVLVCFVLSLAPARAEVHGSEGQNQSEGGLSSATLPDTGSSDGGEEGQVPRGGALVLPGKGSRGSIPSANSQSGGPGQKSAKAKDAEPGGDGKDAPPAGESKSVTGDVSKLPPPYSVFIVGSGPSRKESKDDSDAAEFLVAFTDLVQKTVPGARVLAVRPFSLPALESVWRDSVKKGRVDRKPANALLLLHTGTSLGYRGDLSLFTDKGVVTEAQLEKSVRELDLALFGKAASSFNKQPRLNTVLLTSFAGSIDCERFPAPVAGITSDNQKRNLDALIQWVPLMKKHLDFPVDARRWFEAWEIATRLGGERGFFCPAKTPKGFLGEKNTPKKDQY